MMEPSFAKLLGLLADANVKFVLVGGLAVTLQGYVRFTEDVDMLIEWKERSVRDKDRLDAMALRELINNPHAFD